MANVGTKMTRGEAQDLLAKFAIENPKYREALMHDPKSVVEKQFGMKLEGVNVKAVVETANTMYVVVPYVAAEGELGEADLEKVAGGFMDQNINAACIGVGAANTVTQINL